MVCIASGFVVGCLPLICCDYVPDYVCDGENILGTTNSTALTSAGATISMFGLSFLYNDVSLIRNIQRARANKPVKGKDIETYMSELFDCCDRRTYPSREDLRMRFFEHHRELSQLQGCAEQVLIERELCRKSNDNSRIECRHDVDFTLGPIHVIQLENGHYAQVPMKFRLLCEILRNNAHEEDAEGQQDLQEPSQERLNSLLGYHPQDRSTKRAK